MSGLHRTAYWQRFIRKMRPIIQQQLPLPCVNAGAHPSCTGIVHPDDKWEVAHLPGLDFSLTGDRYPGPQDVGPAHRACNRAAGGRLGAAKQTRTRARDTRWLPW